MEIAPTKENIYSFAPGLPLTLVWRSWRDVGEDKFKLVQKIKNGIELALSTRDLISLLLMPGADDKHTIRAKVP